MTIIEFFDPNAIHNALSLFLLSPERIILFGDDAEEMYKFRLRLEKLISKRKMHTRVQLLEVQKHDYHSLIRKLETLLLTYHDCIFDVTGGTPEVLVAMGALSQKHNVPTHLSDPVRTKIVPFSGSPVYPSLSNLAFSISEHATLYGGKMTESFVPPRTDFFWSDVLRVWQVASQNPSRWNSAISALHVLSSPESMSAIIYLDEAEKRLSPQKYSALLDTSDALFRAGCFSDYRKNKKSVSFRFRSRAIMSSLEKEGSVLELYTYYTAMLYAKDTPFTDGAVGVMMDWDTIPASIQKEDVKNEIDVFLMHGISPVLISCKNGFVDTDELYKLHVVSMRFGGKYASSKIILTQHIPDAAFLARAKELGIQVIRNVHTLTTSDFAKLLTQK